MMRRPLKTKTGNKSPVVSSVTFRAPVRGWNTRDPVQAMSEGYARELTNWWPETSQVSLRKGAADHHTGLILPVKSLAQWASDSQSVGDKLWAFTDDGIYDATTAGAGGAAALARTEGYTISTGFSTQGGTFLFTVNGQDDLAYYNGSTWTTIASFPITGGGTLLTADIAFVFAFKRRLFFIKKDSANFYYLPVNAITGDVALFPLNSLFSEGGYLAAMGSWTIDGGSGPDDYAIFVSSEGQVAVYAGTDPSDAGAWANVGLYMLSKPLGRKCLQKYGGDVLLLSIDGVFPMAKALQSTTISYDVAVSDVVAPSFTQVAGAFFSNLGWEAATLATESLLLVNIPSSEFEESAQYAMNTKTKAWALFSGWNAFCFCVFQNQLYAGFNGKVVQLWTGRDDFNQAISAAYRDAYKYFGSRAQSRFPKLVRPNLIASGEVEVEAGFDTDFTTRLDYSVLPFYSDAVSLWDSALWDSAVWTADALTTPYWSSVPAHPGYCHSFRLRTDAIGVSISWSAVDVLYELGGFL